VSGSSEPRLNSVDRPNGPDGSCKGQGGRWRGRTRLVRKRDGGRFLVVVNGQVLAGQGLALESRGLRELIKTTKESFRLVTHYGVIEGEGLFFT
jgi:hypothetical protein